jgi:atrazine chlorohydrolase/5-methylthioadenosine/S-adenosylhomocysteine deaminase/melamine deaminase
MAVTAIRGGTLVTVDAHRRVIPDGGVLIEDGSIAWVGPSVSMPPVDGARVLDTTGMVVMPGLVNAHTHVAQILLRGGLSHSRRLYDWLLNVVCPGLAQYGPGDHRSAIRLYAAEAIHSGITTIVTNEEPDYTDSENATRIALDTFGETGLRVIYARMFRDQLASGTAELFREERTKAPELADSPTVVRLESTLAELERLNRAYRHAWGGRVAIWPSPATTAATSAEALRRTAELADALGIRWALHLAETTLETEIRPISPVRYLQELGVLGPRLLAAHCVHVDDDDIALLARHGVNVVTLPVSNCYLGSGIAPVPRLRDAGVTVAIGTDDANCNDSVNLFHDMKFLALIHRGLARDPALLSPQCVIDMATIDGARALGLDDRIGSLEVGKRADVIVCRLDRPQTTPVHDVMATLLFQAYGSEVETVLVDGQLLLREGKLMWANESEVCRDAQRRSQGIVARAGLRWDPGRPAPKLGLVDVPLPRATGA